MPASKGMGLLIGTAQGSFDTDGVFAAIPIAEIAPHPEGLATLLERRPLVWRRGRRHRLAVVVPLGRRVRFEQRPHW